MSDDTLSNGEGDLDRLVAGRALRALRVRAGLTQAELAARSGMWAHYISDVERGRRRVSWETIVRLLRAMGVAARDFAEEVEAQERAGAG